MDTLLIITFVSSLVVAIVCTLLSIDKHTVILSVRESKTVNKTLTAYRPSALNFMPFLT